MKTNGVMRAVVVNSWYSRCRLVVVACGCRALNSREAVLNSEFSQFTQRIPAGYACIQSAVWDSHNKRWSHELQVHKSMSEKVRNVLIQTNATEGFPIKVMDKQGWQARLCLSQISSNDMGKQSKPGILVIRAYQWSTACAGVAVAVRCSVCDGLEPAFTNGPGTVGQTQTARAATVTTTSPPWQGVPPPWPGTGPALCAAASWWCWLLPHARPHLRSPTAQLQPAPQPPS